ncbi:MAG: hypothetical protein M1370_08845 [Bacteroidetes bacterium]|nr:hypothetical protein [Bacteroidota bacterium]MCL5026678.1 hypothetical protein [Chloroflexota bacterium]
MPLKLGVITDEISQDFEHALKTERALGAETVELRSLWGRNIADLPDAEVERALLLVREHGLAVNCIASPFLKVDLHPLAVLSDERAVAIL